MMYEKKQAWSILFRLYHWSLVFSICFLAVTGYYIHEPWSSNILGDLRYPVDFMRYVHFVAGFVFVAAIVVRLYLFLFGNKQERILSALPVTPSNIKNLFSTLAFYGYITDRHNPRLGHNVLAGLTYLFTLFLALGQLLTGFYMLYPESAFWQSLGFPLFGPQQQARFIHFCTMWYFFIFVPTHIYIIVWNDVKSPEGLISSIFNGDKFHPKHDTSAKT